MHQASTVVGADHHQPAEANDDCNALFITQTVIKSVNGGGFATLLPPSAEKTEEREKGSADIVSKQPPSGPESVLTITHIDHTPLNLAKVVDKVWPHGSPQHVLPPLVTFSAAPPADAGSPKGASGGPHSPKHTLGGHYYASASGVSPKSPKGSVLFKTSMGGGASPKSKKTQMRNRDSPQPSSCDSDFSSESTTPLPIPRSYKPSSIQHTASSGLSKAYSPSCSPAPVKLCSSVALNSSLLSLSPEGSFEHQLPNLPSESRRGKAKE